MGDLVAGLFIGILIGSIVTLVTVYVFLYWTPNRYNVEDDLVEIATTTTIEESQAPDDDSLRNITFEFVPLYNTKNLNEEGFFNESGGN